MKFLFFGDKHERATAPENRIGDFNAEVQAKTDEIIALGKKHEVKAFLQPGDFWESPNPPLDYASKVMKRWTNIDLSDALAKLVSGSEADVKAIVDSFKKDYIPMVGVVGNHELVAGNLNTLPRTMAGFINQLGLTKFATKDNPVIFETEEGFTVAITGTHYHLGIDYPMNLDDYVVEEKLGDYHIHIVHGMLSDKDMGKYIRHTLIDSIKHTKADLTLSGHDHIGFPVTEVDGKYFANPGAVVRLSNDLKEIARQPKVLLIDINKESGITLQEIPLESAKKGELVLDRKKIEEKKAKEARLEAFREVVRKAEVTKSADIVEIVRNISDNQSLDEDIRESVVGRLTDKMDKHDASTHRPDPVIVDKIILENFQCHEYTELELDKGFNVLVGESSQGKSAIMRAFQWVYENKPRGKRHIRRGSDYARVTLHLSNGYMVERYIESKTGGKNGYYVTDPATGTRDFSNTKALGDIQDILGFHSLTIDKDLEINLNFMKQGTGWFLIGDHITAPNRARIIGGIYGTQYADAVVRDLEKEDRVIREKTKASVASIEKIDKQLEEYDYLPDLKVAIERVEQRLETVEALKERRRAIEGFIQKRRDSQTAIEAQESILEELKDLENIHEKVVASKAQTDRRNQIGKWMEKQQESAKLLRMVNESIEATKLAGSARSQLGELQAVITKRKQLEDTLLKRHKVASEIQGQEEIITATGRVATASQLLRENQEKLQRKSRLTEHIERAEKLETKHKEAKRALGAIQVTTEKTARLAGAKESLKTIEQLMKRKDTIAEKMKQRQGMLENWKREAGVEKEAVSTIATQVQTYKEVLKRAGKCPVCLGTIDKATINRIVEEYQTGEGR